MAPTAQFMRRIVPWEFIDKCFCCLGGWPRSCVNLGILMGGLMKQVVLEKNMTKSILSVRWNHSMATARKFMEEYRIRHLPVIGEDGVLVGILSDRDVKRATNTRSDQIPKEYMVADFMNWPVLTVDVNESLVKVLDTMIDQKISALVVTKNNMLAGITTSEDMLKAFRDLLKENELKSQLTLLDFAYTPYVQEFVREASAAGI